MKKILIFYPYFSTSHGAWGTRYYEFARRWVKNSYDVTVVTSIYDKSDLSRCSFINKSVIEGIKVISLKVGLSNKHGKTRRLFSYLVYSTLSSCFSVFYKADVVIVSSGPITVGLAGIMARMLRKRRVIFEARDVWPDTAIQLGFLTKKISCVAAHFFESLCYKSSHKIVALSPDMKDIISTRTHKHISVISNACDLDVFSPNREPTEKIRTFSAEKFIVIYSGTMGLANNVREIVEIAGLMQNINTMVQFILLGDGKESEQIKQQITQRHIGNVHMLGNRPKYEVADWYSVSKISLCCFSDLPILSTNSPNKFFDSLAAGRPILNNTRGWIKKLLEDHGCGYSYEPGAYHQAVDFINYLVNHQEKLVEMSQNARVLAERHFSRDLLANRYMEEFE